MTADGDAQVAAIESALVRIRRRQSRRILGRAALEGQAEPVSLDSVAALDAVEEGLQEQAEVTVGDVAERLGIDPSRASRIVAAAVNAGYLQRVAAQSDGRRTCLTMTTEGQAIIGQAHRARQAMIQSVVSDWSPRDRAEFARLLTRFTHAIGGADRKPGGSSVRS